MKIRFDLPYYCPESFEEAAAESLVNDRTPFDASDEERLKEWKKARADIKEAYPLFRAMLAGLTAYEEDKR